MTQTDYRQLLTSALQEIRRLRSDAEAMREPIAIVGSACRFAGADSPEELFAVSNSGIDTTSETPADRWDAAAFYDADRDKPGKIAVRRAHYVRDVRGFDAAFFGLSPREARSIDPQQRLLLELTWEALERAAIDPHSLNDMPVGVFVGLANIEYPWVTHSTGDLSLINGHYATGNSGSAAAGRIAYNLGLRGPVMTIDTACSSSLVAVHLAAAALRNRECQAAIVGGVNLMLIPETSIAFSNARMLASDGRCKPFSDKADGYGRGEGGGAVILKRLANAVRDRDPIEAVLLGNAVNHNGCSAGLSRDSVPRVRKVERREWHPTESFS